MPVDWTYRGRVLTLVFCGLVERHEIESALASALADPRGRSGLGLLWDARASQTPLTAEDVSWRVDLVSSRAERGLVRRGAVLLSDRWRATLDYFRVDAGRLAKGLKLEMFVDEAEALAWLESGSTT